MTIVQYYYSREILNSFLSNFDCFSISVLTRRNYSLLFHANCWSLWLGLYEPQQWLSLSWCMKFSKCTAPFHITYELSQMMEIPLGMPHGMICVEKFHTKTVSILSFLMLEKCRFRENYPCPFFNSFEKLCHSTPFFPSPNIFCWHIYKHILEPFTENVTSRH